MKAFKLVNKTQKTFYPDKYNVYSDKFHFDPRLVLLYEIEPSQTSITDNMFTVNNGNLNYIGNLKNNIDVFDYYLKKSIPLSNATEIYNYWVSIINSDCCGGLGAINYFIFYEMDKLFNIDELIPHAIINSNYHVVLHLINKFKIENIDNYMISTEPLESLSFTKAILPYLSKDYIANLDIVNVCANHRYKTVKHLLTETKNKYVKKN